MPINSLDEMHNDFMIYAKEVNENRSFPDARDGLKPGMRASLYTMYNHGFSSNKPHVKSAKITGATIAELWPHGDGSIYDTIVRMSQPWVNNLCEIDWHGANGSLLGGPQAASSRYTECRLSKVSEDGFLTNIKKDTVDMQLNFSEDAEWPIVFPSIFPRLFVNGSQGIGYTIAQEWEPGNLKEYFGKVKQYLDSGKVTCDGIYPDYPTAGIIINRKDMHLIYETGKGTVVLRGKTEIDGNIIKILSLPYQVYVEPLISTIKELVNSGKLTGIEDIYNKSDDSGMLIEVECSGDPNQVLSSLFKLTDLQCTFSANQMALVNGKPEMLTLEGYIKVYVDHNLECIKREYEYDLNKANSRLEIVNGLLKAIGDIDNVISTIKGSKSSDDAKKNLVSKGYTQNQAQAIVDMRLGRLAHLESSDLTKEKTSLDKTIKDCTKMLSSEKLQKKELLKRLEDFTTKYSWERRTEVVDIDIKEEKQKAVKAVSSEQFIIALTDSNTIKRISLTEFRPNKGINLIKSLKISNREKVILISNFGKMYKVLINKIALCTMKSMGTLIDDLVDLESGEKIINIFSGLEEDPYMFFITSQGRVKKMNSTDVTSISKSKGTTVIKLKDEELSWVDIIEDKKIDCKTIKKNAKIDTSKYKSKGRGAGGVNCIRGFVGVIS